VTAAQYLTFRARAAQQSVRERNHSREDPVAKNRNKKSERQKAEEELRLLFQVSVQDLAFFMKQQWSVTNYILLLFGALFAISRIDSLKVGSCERLVLCLVATGLTVLGVWLVYTLQKSIMVRQDRLKNIRRTFTRAFCLARYSKHKVPNSAAIARLLYAVMVFGALFVWRYVFFAQ
jgi:hypothetical protein